MAPWPLVPGSEHLPAERPRSQKARQSWAMLMKRVFALDVLECEHCGGPMRVIAALQEPAQIRRVLSHLGLEAETPRLHPARAPPETELWPAA